MKRPSLLIIDDDLKFYRLFLQIFQSYFDIEYTTDANKGIAMIAQGGWHAVILDLSFPGYYTYKQGLDILLDKALKKAGGRFPVIVATSDNEFNTEWIAIDSGAEGFLRKAEYEPLEWGQFIKNWITNFKPGEKSKNRRNKGLPETLVATSPAMQVIKARLRQLVNYAHAPVLITGETGVGKEVAARYLHESKGDRQLPFQSINLSSLNPELLGSEIYGHVKGAFTTANFEKTGFFEEVRNGTLFLDEIGEISIELQVKLLKVIEDRVFQKVGSTLNLPLRAHLVFATNRNLIEAVRSGAFRHDFYERIKTFSIHLPPLRERKEEIFPLICRFFEELCQETHPFFGKNPEDCFTEAVLEKLHAYSWPGNVRELRSVVDNLLFEAEFQKKRIVDIGLLNNIESLQPEKIPLLEPQAAIEREHSEKQTRNAQIDWSIDKQTAYNELAQIEKALVRSGGGKDEAAKSLGLKNDQALRYKVKTKYYAKYPELFENFKIVHKKYISK